MDDYNNNANDDKKPLFDDDDEDYVPQAQEEQYNHTYQDPTQNYHH